MNKLYLFFTTILSSLVLSQTILNQSEISSRTVSDPQAVVLAQGFHATSSVSNPFVAKIGASSDNPTNPTDSDAGSTNPSGTNTPLGISFHDTQGNIEVNGGGQLQYTLPISLPPGVKSVAPQINLVYTSGSGNGIAGYGWNLSGITAISRSSRTIEKDGEVNGIKLDYSDYYSFNGQRLILKSGEYGKDGAEYVTEKYSNIKIKSIGTFGSTPGPGYWEVTFEDGSQAWYGSTTTGGFSAARTPVEYNIVKWKDAQGNYIVYDYIQSSYSLQNQNNQTSIISSIKWGGNESLSKPHFNEIKFEYITRDFVEQTYVSGYHFIQSDLLKNITVSTNIEIAAKQFKKYEVSYKKQGTNYQFVDFIIEKNSEGLDANPVVFTYPSNVQGEPEVSPLPNNDPFEGVKLTGDFNGDSYLDFVMNNGTVKLGAFNDNFSIIPTNKYFGSDVKVVNTLIDNDGSVYKGNGIIQIDKNKLEGYILKNNTFQKIFEKQIFENPCSQYSLPTRCSISTTLMEGDINGDGISDAIIKASANITEFIPCYNSDNNFSDPEGYCPETRTEELGNFIVDLKNQNNPIATYTNDIGVTDGLFPNQKYMDLDGDGKTEIISVTNSKWTIIDFLKTGTSQYLRKIRVTTNLEDAKSNDFPVLYGDYNGDGKIDFAIPTANQSYSWRFYMGTGYGFNTFLKSDFLYYRNPLKEMNNSYVWNANQYFYSVSDLNKDGKSDIVSIFAYSSINAQSGYKGRDYGFVVYPKIANNLLSNGTIDFVTSQTYTSQKWYVNGVDNFNLFQPITNPIKSNNNYYSIFLYREDKQFKIKAPTSLGELARVQSIKQGNNSTIVEYKELVPDSSDFYKNPVKEIYPYVSFDRVDQTFLVSKINSGFGGLKKQMFKYRGFTLHLAGKGMLGFRHTARSSIYADGFENTVIWGGAEIDPLNESVPIKEWSVKTFNDNNLIFPTDISENNNQLLSYKKTDYYTDVLANGVKATVPWKTKSKDFLKNIISESEITYGAYYLPAQTNTSINGGFATSQTIMSYDSKPLNSGKDYYIGRPLSKSETTTAYNDTKEDVESYDYLNNQLDKVTKKPSATSKSSIISSYKYDGWGNVTEKKTSFVRLKVNQGPSLTQVEKAGYDDKGRFVIKKTDNLNLEINISYNDWGQILTQNDPFGVVLTNTYDGWGKLLTSKTNLAGTTSYSYYRDFGNGDVLGGYTPPKTVISQTAPDGNTKDEYINANGQTYLVRYKVFGQNNYGNVSTEFDPLDRKVKESEPYYNNDPRKWNEIQYDDTIFPAKVTATSFNGKQMETSVTGRITSVKELNGYNRTNTKTTDELGNVITATDKGGTINFSYNAAGQQTIAQYDTNTVTTTYDDWGRKTTFSDPSNGTYTYDYDGFGRILQETSPKGTKGYVYNNFGQLYQQKELSNDGTSTNKSITYAYNPKGLITTKIGTANGKAYSSVITYDTYGRVISSSENSNGKYFMKKGVTYDDKMRVISYEKSLYSSGIYTKVTIENVYEPWSGKLYQVKDKTHNKTLWELQSAEADGRILTARLGGTSITNQYSSNNFLYTTQHKNSANNATVLQMTYGFDAIKNELNSRTRGGDFNISESFQYDDNNRLVNWTDPATGIFTQNAVKNTYDDKGRIINNDQVGEIKFADKNKIYQATGMVLNNAGQQNYNTNLLQKITYNENNDPIFIDGLKGDVAFTYGLSNMRQTATYGGNFVADGTGKFTKYYSEDGSYEIVINNQTGQEKHILYIGGTPYESSIVYLKDYAESSGSYKFLHKDYLGSILAISDEAGNALEQRHYDAWGSFTHLKVGSQSIIVGVQQLTDYLATNNLLLDRGYTGHEHFSQVGLIHMNGRLYDPLLRRFLNADENIQDPTNTQNYNKYGYVMNNPMVYMDPSGEFIWMAVGFLVGAYMAGAQANGGYNPTKWNWGPQTWGKMLMGGAIGAVSGGIGAAAGASAMAASGFTGVIGGLIAGSVGGAVGGAISGLGNAVMFGGNPVTGALYGALSGAVVGGVVGGVAGGVSTLYNNSKIADPLLRSNIWTGKQVAVGRSPWAFNNIEKPTPTVGKPLRPIVKIGDIGIEENVKTLTYNPVTESYDEIESSYTRFINTEESGTIDLKPTLQRIESGGSFPHRNDGSTFRNFPPRGQTESLLPVQPQGYYTEHVVPTPGLNHPGTMRIVKGLNGEMWFTRDHYSSFIKIK